MLPRLVWRTASRSAVVPADAVSALAVLRCFSGMSTRLLVQWQRAGGVASSSTTRLVGTAPPPVLPWVPGPQLRYRLATEMAMHSCVFMRRVTGGGGAR